MRAANVLHLGFKELRSLARDRVMVGLIVYSFTVAIYAAATVMPQALQKAPIAVVDEDRSQLSARIIDALYPPYFLPPVVIALEDLDPRMDAGIDTFGLYVPAGFERDLLAGRAPALQLNVDATRMTQGFNGASHIAAIITGEVDAFLRHHRVREAPQVELALRARFNPQLDKTWFGSVMELVNSITLLSLVLTGAALIREREHGTVEHLLVMPVTPFEIMASKVWSMGLVVLVAATLSLALVVQGSLHVPIEGSIVLFLAGAALHLVATTSLGIFLATFSRSMPQFGLLMLLVLLPLEILSGGMTPRESMPAAVKWVMSAAPTTHFVSLSQAVLYRGAGFTVVWPQFLALAAIGVVLFGLSMARFRRTLASLA